MSNPIEAVFTPTVRVVAAYANPEGVAAGMAKVSRSDMSIEDLIADAKEHTSAARRMNERVVFGYGHSSIAEHACFSLAIEDIPRYLTSELLAHRLASYTMLSYRYVAVSAPKALTPLAIRENAKLALLAEVTLVDAYDAYAETLDALVARNAPPEPTPDRAAELTALRREATEDARYALPLSVVSKLGLTANARELAHMIRRLISSPSRESVALGLALKDAVQPKAPSLLLDKYLTPFPQKAAVARAIAVKKPPLTAFAKEDNVTLIRASNFGEHELADSILSSNGYGSIFEAGRALSAEVLSYRARGDQWEKSAQRLANSCRDVILASCVGLTAHDPMPREFEVVNYAFEVILSEAGFHQLLRHRMMTVLPGPRGALASFAVPPKVSALGAAYHERFADACVAQWRLFERVADAGIPVEDACAVLSNAHHRRVFVSLNARQLIELSRLRMDAHAQWEIRDVVTRMVELVKAMNPTIASLCGGRDAFKGWGGGVKPSAAT